MLISVYAVEFRFCTKLSDVIAFNNMVNIITFAHD